MFQRSVLFCAVACYGIQASIAAAVLPDEMNETACLLQNQFVSDKHMSTDEDTARMPLVVDKESAALSELHMLDEAVQVSHKRRTEYKAHSCFLRRMASLLGTAQSSNTTTEVRDEEEGYPYSATQTYWRRGGRRSFSYSRSSSRRSSSGRMSYSSSRTRSSVSYSSRSHCCHRSRSCSFSWSSSSSRSISTRSSTSIKISTSSSSSRRSVPPKKHADFKDKGAGCCSNRDASKMLFKGNVGCVFGCKAKCTADKNCYAIEYGWRSSKWCTLIPKGSDCNTLASGPKDCGTSGGPTGGNTGVRTYVLESRFVKPKTTTATETPEPTYEEIQAKEAKKEEKRKAKEKKEKEAKEKEEAKKWKKKKFSNPNARCKGAPVKIPGKKGAWGTDWGNLGHKEMSKQTLGNRILKKRENRKREKECKAACLEQPLCKFATFNQDNGHCTAFDSCDKGEKVDKSKKGKEKAFLVWEKVGAVKDETTTTAPGEAPEESAAAPEEEEEEEEEEDEEEGEEEEEEGEEEEEEEEITKEDLFPDLGVGCCLHRDPSKFLFKGMIADLDACKAKCESNENCTHIEYGWKGSKWCTLIPKGTDCSKLAFGSKDCGSGGGDNGVHTYANLAAGPEAEAASVDEADEEDEKDMVDLGAGCCGQRDPSNMLFKGMVANLSACQAKCLANEKCETIEYGWKGSKWCTLIPEGVNCSTLTAGPKDCGSGGGDNGVHTYTVLAVEPADDEEEDPEEETPDEEEETPEDADAAPESEEESPEGESNPYFAAAPEEEAAEEAEAPSKTSIAKPVAEQCEKFSFGENQYVSTRPTEMPGATATSVQNAFVSAAGTMNGRYVNGKGKRVSAVRRKKNSKNQYLLGIYDKPYAKMVEITLGLKGGVITVAATSARYKQVRKEEEATAAYSTSDEMSKFWATSRGQRIATSDSAVGYGIKGLQIKSCLVNADAVKQGKAMDTLVDDFIDAQAGSEDACHSQFLEARHQMNQLHALVSDLARQVNATEEQIMVYDKMLEDRLQEMRDLTEWKNNELKKCAAEKRKAIQMFTKLKKELEEMQSIANPSVAMDIEDGKLHEVSFTQMSDGHLTAMIDAAGKDYKPHMSELNMLQQELAAPLSQKELSSGHVPVTPQNKTKPVAGRQFPDKDLQKVSALVADTQSASLAFRKCMSDVSLLALSQDAEPLRNGGRDCWGGCRRKGGYCNWCGKGNACCRKDWQGKRDPKECNMAVWASNHRGHQCVTVQSSEEKCKEEKEELEKTYVKAYVELSRLKGEYEELANSTACVDTTMEQFKNRKVPLQSQADKLATSINEEVQNLQSLRPRLEGAIRSEAKLKAHLKDLSRQCGDLGPTVSDLKKVRDTITALSSCPGLSRVKFSLPKWVGSWATFNQNGKAHTDEKQDKLMNAACQKLEPGSRAAEVDEIQEQTVQDMPTTNTASSPLLGACPDCAGPDDKSFQSGHSRVCWQPEVALDMKSRDKNCGTGRKAILCVIDQGDIRDIPGEGGEGEEAEKMAAFQMAVIRSYYIKNTSPLDGL